MYAPLGLLGLLATAGFLHACLFRRRQYLILFAVAQAAMLYTHAWGIFFGAGSVIALIPIWKASPDRRGIVRDALMAYIGAGILFLPWLPTFLYQSQHTAAPWDSAPRFGAPVQLSRDLLGGDRVAVALLIAAVIGFIAMVRGERGAAAVSGDGAAATPARSPYVTALWVLIVLPTATLLLAWLASQITPAWVSRYFAPILAPILLLAAFGCSRAGVVGFVAIAASVVFVANPASFTPAFKSDVRDVGGEMSNLMHPGDFVVVGQPEQVPLTWYYLPPGLQYANTIGPVKDPRYMNWADALKRLTDADWASEARSLVASLRPGQQVLFVRPLTEGAQSWQAPWTVMVRRRSAQWGSILSSDRTLKVVTWAPHNYRGACCVADSAVLYQKVS